MIDATPDRDRDRRGRFKAGCKPGPGRPPKAPPSAEEQVLDQHEREQREAGARIDAMLARDNSEARRILSGELYPSGARSTWPNPARKNSVKPR